MLEEEYNLFLLRKGLSSLFNESMAGGGYLLLYLHLFKQSLQSNHAKYLLLMSLKVHVLIPISPSQNQSARSESTQAQNRSRESAASFPLAC